MGGFFEMLVGTDHGWAGLGEREKAGGEEREREEEAQTPNEPE
jgi:hypothetical protein